MDIVGNRNICSLWDSLAELYGSKTALIFVHKDGKEERFTYEELNYLINKTANMFLHMGIKKGDRIALKLCNRVEFLLCWFGANKIGAVIVPINTHYSDKESAFVLNSCLASICVTYKEYCDSFKQMQKKQEISKDIIFIVIDEDEHKEESFSFNKLIKKENILLDKKIKVKSSDIAEILYTSGTTSTPKGAVITHYNLIFAGHYTSWQACITDKDIYLTSMPSFHIDFQCTAAMPAFTAGAAFVMIEKYSASKFWKQVVNYKATITECIPFTIRTLLAQPVQKWEKNHNLREILYYLCMNEDEKEQFLKRFNVRLLTSYGMTETIVGLIGDVPGLKRKSSSIGKAGLCYEAKIVNEEGKICKPLEQGEIWVKGVAGKTLFKGYYNNSDATKKIFTKSGWLKTGDIGYMDHEGYFFFLDRNVNMIKRSGENISCTEIENIIETHPKVIETAVIGVSDGVYDEVVKAFCTIHDNQELSLKELQEYCKEYLADFKIPVYLEILKSFPKTATGKIQKNLLKETVTCRHHK